MTEFESEFINKALAEIHKLEVHLTKELSDLKGAIEGNQKLASAEHRALKEIVERNIQTDEKRLDDHAADIDDLRNRVIMLEESKENQKEKEEANERKFTNRIVLFTGIASILGALIAVIVGKFLG